MLIFYLTAIQREGGNRVGMAAVERSYGGSTSLAQFNSANDIVEASNQHALTDDIHIVGGDGQLEIASEHGPLNSAGNILVLRRLEDSLRLATNAQSRDTDIDKVTHSRLWMSRSWK